MTDINPTPANKEVALAPLNGEVISPDPRALRINAKHREAIDSMGKAIKAAMDCGDELRKKKDEIAHGQFGPWLRDNTNVMPRTAQEWMQLSVHRKQIEAAMLHDGLNPIAGAMRLIRQSPGLRAEATISEDEIVTAIIKKVQVVLGKDHKRGLIIAQRIAELLSEMRLVD